MHDSFLLRNVQLFFWLQKKCPFNHTLILQKLYLYSFPFLLHVLGRCNGFYICYQSWHSYTFGFPTFVIFKRTSIHHSRSPNSPLMHLKNN